MSIVEEITASIAELPPEQVARIRAWLDEPAETESGAQIEQDDGRGKLDALAAQDSGRNPLPEVVRKLADAVLAERREQKWPNTQTSTSGKQSSTP